MIDLVESELTEQNRIFKIIVFIIVICTTLAGSLEGKRSSV